MKMSVKLYKKLIVLCLISCCIYLVACQNLKYEGERPYDYPDATWISKDPDMWFYVDYPYDQPYEDLVLHGELEQNGEVIDIMVTFDEFNNETTIGETPDEETMSRLYAGEEFDYKRKFFVGNCEFAPDKLVVIVNKEKDTLLDGKYNTITFIRVPDETESESK